MVVLIFFFGGGGTAEWANHRMALAGFKPRTQWDDLGFSSQRLGSPSRKMGSEQPATMVILMGCQPNTFMLRMCFFFHGLSSI